MPALFIALLLLCFALVCGSIALFRMSFFGKLDQPVLEFLALGSLVLASFLLIGTVVFEAFSAMVWGKI